MITDVALQFNSNNIVQITNNRVTDFDYSVYNIDIAGNETVIDTDIITANGGIGLYTFTDDGMYFIQDNADPDEDAMVIIYADVLTALKVDVKDVLLETDKDLLLAKGYDFVALALISVIFFGNTAFQFADQDAQEAANYVNIAIAIDECSKYLDVTDNTPQSNNVKWLQ